MPRDSRKKDQIESQIRSSSAYVTRKFTLNRGGLTESTDPPPALFGKRRTGKCLRYCQRGRTSRLLVILFIDGSNGERGNHDWNRSSQIPFEQRCLRWDNWNHVIDDTTFNRWKDNFGRKITFRGRSGNIEGNFEFFFISFSSPVHPGEDCFIRVRKFVNTTRERN